MKTFKRYGKRTLGPSLKTWHLSLTTVDFKFYKYSRPRAQFLPIRTSQPVNNIYLSIYLYLLLLYCKHIIILYLPLSCVLDYAQMSYCCPCLKLSFIIVLPIYLSIFTQPALNSPCYLRFVMKLV